MASTVPSPPTIVVLGPFEEAALGFRALWSWYGLGVWGLGVGGFGGLRI